MGRCINGMVTGMIVGATIGIMVMPQLDRRTQRTVKKFSRKVASRAMGSYDGIASLMH